jgi:CHAT domain-containing protein/pimeloyl-ACP methyl ester carboxylesterase
LSEDEKVYYVRGAVGQGRRPPSGELVTITSAIRVEPGQARDGATAEARVSEGDVARIELENGFVLWSRFDDAVAEHGRFSGTRSGTPVLELDRLVPRRGSAARGERGLLGYGVKALEFFGVDLKKKAAADLGDWLEMKQLGDAPGLYRCALGGAFMLAPVADAAIQTKDGRILVFLHGTASSTVGSFGKLVNSPEARAALQKQYGDAVYALQHRSLTESPIQNALALLETLEKAPDGTEIHLVSHSRGGLVGEVLCLGQCENFEKMFSADRLKSLFTGDGTIAEQLGLAPYDEDGLARHNAAYDADRERLLKVIELFRQRQFRIGRFVRVACPARGTTLASGRLDRWFSVLNFLIGKAGGDLAGDCSEFMAAIAKQRTDPRTLPGLEAMMPGSALTQLLNYPEFVTAADLSIIAGDAEGNGVWGQIKMFVADWFFGADHDLVVNTGSMYGGIKRSKGGARFLVDRGAEVSHFEYFVNARSIGWLIDGLARKVGQQGGFQPIEKAVAEPVAREAMARSQAKEGPRPFAIILPGVMGSALDVGGANVWLDYLTVATGGLDRLRMGSEGVASSTLLDDFYGPLIEYLAETHRVEALAYDWRLSIEESAKRLRERLQILLPEAKRLQQPIHIVAHSMGGLVVRAMLADPTGNKVLHDCLALKDSRFLMLGTPNRGSHEAVRWLTGLNPTLVKLKLLDLAHDANGIIDIVRSFPGLLELLPSEDDGFFDAQLWARLKQSVSEDWPLAEVNPLRNAWATLRRVAATQLPKQGVVYVAGCQDMTVSSYEVVDDHSFFARPGAKRLQFKAVREGDGTVTWKSGLIPGVPTWYVEQTAHDQLCTQRSAFAGYLDLLRTGTTTRLSSKPPATRGADAGAEFVLPDVPPADDIPGPNDMRKLGFGSAQFDEVQASDIVRKIIRVTVRHGDLAYARHPVVVGHYLGDTIVSAEKALDERLEGALSRRLRLGLYPGVLGTHAVFLQRERWARPKGAVVLGLGQVGELSQTQLQARMRDALLELALQVAQLPDDERFGAKGAVRSAAVSCLLVGSGSDGVTVRDSIEAVLRAAVGANEKLGNANLERKVTIDRIEFLEIYQDVALTAAEALGLTLLDGELSRTIIWNPSLVEEGQGGLSRIKRDDPPGWWRRMEVIEERIDGKWMGLRFVASTDRARAETTQAVGQLRLAESFINEASSGTENNSKIAKTLFEMLLPNRLKELASRQSNIVLLVDDVSARYPWELLEDRDAATGRPAAIQAGLVRQLKTPRFRPAPLHATDHSALVVGDPDLDGSEEFPQLSGAEREARAVEEVLTQEGYRVDSIIGGKTTNIIQALHKRPWRILHLAGHGVHEKKVTLDETYRNRGNCKKDPEAEEITISGMVIGKDAFLTPGDVEQIRCAPELVFINCCHLGQTQESNTRFSALAANIGVQFIEMGVKAVIAAGWAVDDRAATAFAESFYRRMFSGQQFGEAVRAAREEIWLRFPTANTWGAYQCYGDPGFRLIVEAERSEKPEEKSKPFYAPAEVVTEIRNLRERLRMKILKTTNGAKERRETKNSLDLIFARIPDEQREKWIARSEIAAEVGFTLGEAKCFTEAVGWLKRAMMAPKSDCPTKVIEQWANFAVRGAAEEWKSLSAADRKSKHASLVGAIKVAIGRLENIREYGETEERLSLLAGAYKHLALLETGRDRQAALAEMAAYYKDAYDVAKKPYAFTNWAIAEILNALLKKTQLSNAALAHIHEAADRHLEALEKSDAEDPDFWNSVSVGDIRFMWLIEALAAGRAPGDGDESGVIDAYRRAMQRGASPREMDSVIDTIDIVLEMTPAGSKTLKGALRRIRDELFASEEDWS